MPELTLHDGSTIRFGTYGTGPALLLPVNPVPVDEPAASAMRAWGADPALGRSLIDGLADTFRVIAVDYEGHVQATPKPDTLTPENVVADLLAVADAAGADRFAYYGYSWLAMIGLQLAIRTDRLSALVMGGYPPIGGPYREMLAVTDASHRMSTTASSPDDVTTPAAGDWDSVTVTATEAQTRQFVTLYQALRDFDDRAAQPRVCCPRLCLVGSADEIRYGAQWHDTHVSIAGPVVNGQSELGAAGWTVRILDGLDHMQAMQAAHVLPVLRPWLTTTLRAVGAS